MANTTTIEKLKLTDISFCVNLYYNLNDHSFVNVDKNKCLKSMTDLYFRKSFMKILKKNDNIIAFIVAVIDKPLHNNEVGLVQIYYACSEKGFTAYKCAVQLHEELIKEGIKQKLDFVLSQGSHMDPEFIFTRILENNGWERRGHVAMRRLPRQGSRFPRQGSRLDHLDTFLSK